MSTTHDPASHDPSPGGPTPGDPTPRDAAPAGPGRERLRARIDAGGEQFRTLPEALDPDRLTTTHDVSPGPDPEAGRDTNHEWMLRHGTP